MKKEEQFNVVFLYSPTLRIVSNDSLDASCRDVTNFERLHRKGA